MNAKQAALMSIKVASFVVGIGYGLWMAVFSHLLTLLPGVYGMSERGFWITLAIAGGVGLVVGAFALRKADRKFHSVTEEATG